MNKNIIALLSIFSVILGTASAEARTTSKRSASTPSMNERVETSMSAPERHSSGVTFGLGVSSITPGFLHRSAGAALTGIVGVTNLDAIQIFAGIPTTVGGFTFGLGVLYKRTVVGNENAGFHVGGGIGMGTLAGQFGMGIPAIMGLHYAVSSVPVAFHLDGGGTFGLQTGGASTETNFTLGTGSSILGASAVYQF